MLTRSDATPGDRETPIVTTGDAVPGDRETPTITATWVSTTPCIRCGQKGATAYLVGTGWVHHPTCPK